MDWLKAIEHVLDENVLAGFATDGVEEALHDLQDWLRRNPDVWKGDCRINDASTNTTGTHLQGYVDISYSRLVEVLGPPLEGDGYKVRAEWTLQRGGVVATIYDWKEYATDVKRVRDWHIGGRDPDAILLVEEVLGTRAIRSACGGW
jgi:hypothetical protein